MSLGISSKTIYETAKKLDNKLVGWNGDLIDIDDFINEFNRFTKLLKLAQEDKKSTLLTIINVED